MSLEAVAKVTKIQPRILERLEAGKLDGLPAEVFVRGFVRSFARCVGLAEDEALRRYAACGLATGTADLTPTVRALVEAMADLAPGSAGPRATPRRMMAVDDRGLSPGGSAADWRRDSIDPPEVIELGAPGQPASAAVVETMMLPETGTVVVPAQLTAMLAEAAAAQAANTAAQVVAVEALPVAPAALPAGSFDALPIVESSGDGLVAEDLAADAPAVEPPAADVPACELEGVAAPAVAFAVEPVATTSEPKKKRSRRGKGRNKRGSDATAGISRELLATGTPPAASPIVTLAATCTPASPVVANVTASPVVTNVTASPVVTNTPASPVVTNTIASPVVTSAAASPVVALDASAGASGEAAAPPADDVIATEPWAPKMPPIAAAPSVPWRKPAYAAASAVAVPSLVIDDADPDSAERVLEERAETLAPRRSFLPPILLDREDRSARQGGLTLAVIILLIAATLTLSYLMRRPSASGDGMTRLETPASQVDGSLRSDAPARFAPRA